MSIRESLLPYTEKNDALAALSYFGTFAVYFSSLALAIAYVNTWYILVPSVLILAFAGVRLYVLQHDCGHHSLFSERWMNEWAGFGLMSFSLSEFKTMQYNHNQHHAFVGNLEARHTTEIYTMTLAEWNVAGFWERLYYRLYRNPLILIPIGSLWTYFFAYRWPKTARRFVKYMVIHNLVLLAWWGLVYALAGWTGLIILLGSTWLGGSFGVFLVYLQHNFEDTWWDRKPDLQFEQATLQGSSRLDFGWFFDLIVASITLHDVHHFNPRIPSYALRKAHADVQEEAGLRVIHFPEAIRSFRLKLWDEDQKRLVPFPRADQSPAAITPAE